MNRVVVITGGSSGIGAAAATRLRQMGATVAITGRSTETIRLAKRIGAEAFLADFARLREVRQLAEALLATYPVIDVLANNAGAVIDRREVTEDGHEKTFQVNHLAGFLLTMLLRERLEESRATVINTSSGAHRFGRIDPDDLENARDYRPWRAYGTAKLMNIVHAIGINRRFPGVSAASFHPGVVATGFAREGSPAIRFLYESPLRRLFMISPEKGADTLVWLATTTPGETWRPGAFYVKRKRRQTAPQATDPEIERRLWEESEKAVEWRSPTLAAGG